MDGTLERDNLTLPMIELADLWHKAKLLRGMLGAGRDFEAELGKVVQLRRGGGALVRDRRERPSLLRFGLAGGDDRSVTRPASQRYAAHGQVHSRAALQDLVVGRQERADVHRAVKFNRRVLRLMQRQHLCRDRRPFDSSYRTISHP